jgi:vitamin B12 transporter
VQIITREQIAQQAGLDVAQLLQTQAGIIVNGAYSNPAKDRSVYLRGADAAYTLILIDGQPVSDPTLLGSTFDLRLLAPEQIERIEILKGSQSTLYGNDAIAGVVNIITRRQAEAAPLAVYGSAAWGSLNTRQGTLGARGEVGQLGYDVSYQRWATDGLSEAAVPPDSTGYDRDGATRDNVQATVHVLPHAQLRISPFVRYSAVDGDNDAGAFVDADDTYTLRLLNPGLHAEADLNGLTLRGHYGYTRTQRTFRSQFGETLFDGRFHQGDLYGSVPLSSFLRLMVGVNAQQQRMLDTATVRTDPSATIVSPYATLLVHTAGGLNAELGYRFNHHSQFGRASTVSVAPSYQFTPTLRAFASFGTGFKAPTLYQLYADPWGNAALEPQRSHTTEGGLSWASTDGQRSARATYFRRRIDEVIGFVNGYRNQERQNGVGLEVEVGGSVGERWRVDAQYTYLEGTSTVRGSREQDSTFADQLRRPRHSASGTLRFTPTPRLQLSVQAQYQSARDDLYFNFSTFTTDAATLDPFMLLNAHATYRITGGFTVFAHVKNLTNADYFESFGFSTLGINGQVGVQFDLFGTE